jgi:hypothetical protein
MRRNSKLVDQQPRRLRLVTSIALIILPTAALGFADRIQMLFLGGWYNLSQQPPNMMLNAALYAAAVSSVLVVVLSTAWTVCKRDLLDWTLITLVLASGCVTLASAIFFGHLALGAREPGLPVLDLKTITEHAAEFQPPSLSFSDPSRMAFVISGLGMSRYDIQTVHHVVPIAPIVLSDYPKAKWWQPTVKEFWWEVLYEEYGFPLRCLRTPIDIGLPRPGFSRLFLDSYQDQFVLKQLGNIRLLPVELAVDIGFTAGVLWLICIAPKLLYTRWQSTRRCRNGACPHCGYLRVTTARCPECGAFQAEQKLSAR